MTNRGIQLRVALHGPEQTREGRRMVKIAAIGVQGKINAEGAPARLERPTQASSAPAPKVAATPTTYTALMGNNMGTPDRLLITFP